MRGELIAVQFWYRFSVSRVWRAILDGPLMILARSVVWMLFHAPVIFSHMIPQDLPKTAYKISQYLLGRVPSLGA